MRYTEKMEDSLFQQWNVNEEDYSGVRAILDSENRPFGDPCMVNSIWSFHN